MAIPKTGSTSIHKGLLPYFERSYTRSMLEARSESIFDTFLAKSPMDIDVDYIREHFPFGSESLFPGDFFTFTFLRHPIQRTISSIQHCMDQNPVKSPRITDVRRKGASAIAKYCYDHNVCCNTMVHQLAGLDKLDNLILRDKQKMRGAFYFPYVHTKTPVGEHDLELAKKNLLKLDFVGIYEHLEQDFERLAKHLNIPARLPTTVYKKTRYRDAFNDCLDIFEKMNQYDLNLYRFAEETRDEKS